MNRIPGMEPDKVAVARQNVERHLEEISAETFKSDMKLTFIARNPANPLSYMLVTSDDDLGAVAELLQHAHEDRPPPGPPAPGH